MPKRIVLLGATGSIGENTLTVVRAHRDALEVVGIAAHRNTEKLAAIAKEFSVPHVAVFDEQAARQASWADDLHLHTGMAGLIEIATLAEADTVLTAIVGTAGLQPTLGAIKAGKDIALASKEILVMAGKFVTAAAKEHNVQLLPVDSEHNALFQCLHGERREDLKTLWLTASGGPFREMPLEAMAAITPAQAGNHPNWKMGQKVTIDSATMANKGLEMIEARWLFDANPEQVQVVVHPQSIVHSLVEFCDGSIIGQLAPPSMTFAIQHALFYPERGAATLPTVDLSEALSLTFDPPNLERFPCLALARQAMETGGVHPAIFNAANEVAVAAFVAEQIGFLDIPRVIGECLSKKTPREPASLEEVIEADQRARSHATEVVAHLSQIN